MKRTRRTGGVKAFQTARTIGFAFVALGLVAGCRGPRGATGPMGPEGGVTAPTYLFAQDFDGLSLGTAVPQFDIMQPVVVGAGFTAAEAFYVSAPYSGALDFTSNPGSGAGLWTSSGAWSAPPNVDLYFDTYINTSTYTNPGDIGELILNVHGVTVATCGFNPVSSGVDNVYTYQAGAQSTLYTGLNATNWHHIVLYWSHTSHLSSVSIDGAFVGETITGDRPLVSGAPPTSAGWYLPFGSGSGTPGIWFDNFMIYYY